MTTVGVVTIAHGRHDHLAAQHRSLDLGSRRPDAYVVVAVDDPAITAVTRGGVTSRVVAVEGDPRGLPLAAARNRGVAETMLEGVDVVVLLDVDCLAGPDLVRAYTSAVAREPDRLWSGPVTYLAPPPPGGYDLADLTALDDPHPLRPAPAPGEVERAGGPDLFWSLSFAVAPATWERVGGFCEEYVGYGGEDTDLARAADRHCVDLWWAGDARAYHQHHPTSSPPVQHLDAILRNARLFHDRWGEWPMRGWLAAFEQAGLVRSTPNGWIRTDAGR